MWLSLVHITEQWAPSHYFYQYWNKLNAQNFKKMKKNTDRNMQVCSFTKSLLESNAVQIDANVLQPQWQSNINNANCTGVMSFLH